MNCDLLDRVDNVGETVLDMVDRSDDDYCA